ncbi:OadG family protein [Spirochaeta isovalerica]|uniref:Sodium pump decarboxylase gamma subunit n=1 Tax=Spirochaeta isovalerica TaxID=150 RepID=A0A841REF2_9SPIO|nr:OadG family protein [Spirochaeta isovalerica]MBB6482455.1 sodium pump decarboxylase gamma subunit [Spirochaeta isovalerica]
MNFFEKGLQNIALNDGYSLSIAGMSIVFLALVVIAAIIKLLPVFLVVLDKIIPEKHIEPNSGTRRSADDGAAVAAIAAAIYKKKQKVG